MTTQLAEIADSRDRIEQMPQDAREMLIASNLEQADAWLRAALDVPSPDPRSIADYKVQVAAIEQMARQLRVSKDLQNNAIKCVRRAERGVGVAIRKGQEEGAITKRGEVRHASGGFNEVPVKTKNFDKTSPYEFASSDELTGNGSGIYHMTDGVSDEQFEEALSEAESEGNLSRANVVRKIKNPGQTKLQLAELIREHAAQGLTSKQIAAKVRPDSGPRYFEQIRSVARECGIDIPGDVVTGTRRNIDADRIIRSPEKPPALAVGRKGRLLVPLVLHVLLDDFQWRAADGGHEVGVGPQCGQTSFEAGELFA